MIAKNKYMIFSGLNDFSLQFSLQSCQLIRWSCLQVSKQLFSISKEEETHNQCIKLFLFAALFAIISN